MLFMRIGMKRTVLAAIIGAICVSSNASETNDKNEINYMPEIHGVVRARWEGEWADNDGFGSRFEVRNARINIGGKVFPTINYYVQFDASDQGKMKFLDAWGRWEFLPKWRIQAGQFRVPFGVDCFKAPGGYYFANRSFIGKHMVNMRQVGVKAGYYGKSGKIPTDIEFGVFNTASTENHNVWQKSYTYAVKNTWYISHIAVSGSFVSYKPQFTRVNVADGCVTWTYDRWVVEGEYQHKWYAGDRFRHVNAWNLYGVYTLPLKNSTVNFMSFEGRFDGMTDHSSGSNNSDGILVADHPSRRRITVGSTIGRIHKLLKAEFSINYEKYFYNKGVCATRGNDDKLLAEITIKF